MCQVPERPTERGSARPLLTVVGPAPWKGGGGPGGRGLRYYCKVSMAKCLHLVKTLLLWEGKREGGKIDGRILSSDWK